MLDRSAKDNVCSAVEALRDDLTKLGLDLGNIEAPLGKERDAGNYVYDWMARNSFHPQRIGATTTVSTSSAACRAPAAD